MTKGGLSMDNPKLAYTRKEAAAAASVSLPTIDQWLHMYGFPSFKVGRKFLIPVKGFTEWLDEQTGNSTNRSNVSYKTRKWLA